MSVKDRFQLLRQADEDHSVFGAGAHGYQTAPPLEARFIDRFEQIHLVSLPDDYRRFIGEQWSSGAGPYGGLLPLNTPVHRTHGRALRLADHGDGEHSWLVLEGIHRGEVWSGDSYSEARTFAAWLEHWTERALCQAAYIRLVRLLSAGEWSTDSLIDAAAPTIERLAHDRSPSIAELRSFVPHCETLRTLGYLRLYQRADPLALDAFERASKYDRHEPVAQLCLAKARFHRARAEHDDWLLRTRDGLQAPDVSFKTKTALLNEQRAALFALDRDEEAILASETLALHTRQLFDVFDTAWHRIERDEITQAARWLLRAAKQGIGCVEGTPVDVMAEQLFWALADDAQGDQAEALKRRLRELTSD